MSNNKILLITDTEKTQSLICQCLEIEGYEIHSATNDNDTYELYDKVQPILVVMDISALVSNRFAFLEKIKSHSAESSVIVLTESKSFKETDKCFEYGVTAFLRKPINECELKGLVRHSIALQQMERNLLHESTLHKDSEKLLNHRTNELLEAYNQNKLILASISSILICVGHNHKITHWNKTAERVFGFTEKEAIGVPFFEFNIDWDWSRITQCISTCQKEKKSIHIKDFKYTSNSRKKGFLNITVSPFAGPYRLGAKHSRFLLLGEDITEHKFFENEFYHAQKLKSVGQLAAGVAHEINTPIQYIGDNIRFIEESVTDLFNLIAEYNIFLEKAKQGPMSCELIADLEKFEEHMDLQYILDDVPAATEQSLEGIKRVAEIVQAMKEFSHPVDTEKALINVNKAIDSVIKVSRNEWKYVAEMKTNIDTDLPLVLCLPGEMNQVYLNLIINAAHAIADVLGDRPENKGCITISTYKIGEQIEVRIKDTGTGIPGDARLNVFDPFFTTKEIGKGTGQGLSIAYAIVVEKHGGSISFETKMGKGTTFIIRLPVGKD